MQSQPSLAVTPLAPVIPVPPEISCASGHRTVAGRGDRGEGEGAQGGVTVTWRPVADVSVYRVQISKPGAKKFKAWKTTTKRVFKAQVRKGQKYRFQVRALGAGGRGPVATIRFMGK